jgi:cytochrome P450
MELQVSFRVLLDRYPYLNLARPPGPPTRFVLKGFDAVELRLGRPCTHGGGR